MGTNPFLIEGPAVISFSGGRTSGYMLRRILDAGLQPDVHVLFANTGKERAETLAFVRECSARWDVPIHWLEYGRGEVDPATAATKGEPFEALITKRKYLPNSIQRFCTQALKISLKAEWMVEHGYPEWNNALGLRADEPRRLAKFSDSRDPRETVLLPLARAGVDVAAVTAFWKASPFDLGLRIGEGNCDLCFLKGQRLRLSLIQDRPESAAWWADQEARIGSQFRLGRASYAALKDAAERAPRLPFPMFVDGDEDPDDLGDCVCHD